MQIHELFEKDVTRDIPPVVYFHEQSPRKLREEVEEYIITGGYPKGDPRSRRVEHGIHEAFVGLLRAMASEMEKRSGPELPAAWISGFYGSGKSSFAKLLGLALDNASLDDQTPLADALLRRDDSPRRQELIDAWEALRHKIDPIAAVFDVGAVARDNEHIHRAALRQVQARLGYCSKSNLVAEWELKLERDGIWNDFLQAAQRTLGKPWKEAKEDELAEDHFSHILHVLQPDRYQNPMDWIDSHAGASLGERLAVKESIDAMDAMLSIRAEGKALFLVVDEVSQYVHQDDDRMLKLQTFVSELGQRLKGAVWLLATGQQKLEDSSSTTSLSKLKDRFPEKLRVHLAATNIRDVVHRRLLKKRADREEDLRALFLTHRADLKLYGYSCEDITEADFLEIYPMLPGHVDLLLQITSSLRLRSSRTQGDDYAIRGLLQLLGELFRSQRLAEGEVGELVTLDAIYEVQQTALDPDIQSALMRIFNHPRFRDDDLAQRATKAVALLELIQESVPTTADLVARCLYSRLGQGNQTQAVSEALEHLRDENLLGYSEKQGYKIQSSAGQEWERERRDLAATPEKRSELIQEKLKELIGTPDRPRWKGNTFPWMVWYSDGRTFNDVRLQDPRTGVAMTVDLRFIGRKNVMSAEWLQQSDQGVLRERLLWVVGEPGLTEDMAKQLFQSNAMCKRYEPRRESLPSEKQRLLIEEQARKETLDRKLRDAVAEAFWEGHAYFRGRSLKPEDFGPTFPSALSEMARRVLPDLFPHFIDIAITDTELNQLLEPNLSGPSTKFMEKGLHILSLDGGRYMPTCAGEVPARVLTYLEGSGAAGSAVVNHFGRPPYGYPPDVIKACLAGLLRAGKIFIQPEAGPKITSVRDPGTKDLFRRSGDLGRADIFPVREGTGVSPRDRVAIGKFFEEFLDLKVDRENDAIADAVFQQFPGRREALRQVESRLNRLPGSPGVPESLSNLGRTMESCMRSRQVEEIVLAVRNKLDALRDGLQQLAIFQSEMTEEAIGAVREASEVHEHIITQLEAVKAQGEVAEEVRSVVEQLAAPQPWRQIHLIAPVIERLREHYRLARRGLLSRHDREAEELRGRIKTRKGFERLNADQSHKVLRPITEALFDTTEDALHPTLVELRDLFPARLTQAEERANEGLDEILLAVEEHHVVKVKASLRGREVGSRQELEALLRELEERIGPLLERGSRVRIV